jgi:L-fuconolactonase
MRVDAHHHLWRYDPSEFGWIDDDAAALRRDFLLSDLESVLADSPIDRTVAVQARESLQETSFLLDCAEQSEAIAGVVGWVPLMTGDPLTPLLEELTARPALVGAREILQNKPDGFLMSPSLSEGVRALTRHGLTYDLLIRCSQLEEAIQFVDLHPNQKFVLDHVAKPQIKEGVLEPWATSIRQLGQRQNVFCKLSGLVTEADWRRWTEADLEPYLDICLEAFGPERCMAGSDWPVCLVASPYQTWWQTLDRWAKRLSAEEQKQVLGGSAISFYQLRQGTPLQGAEQTQ